MFCIKCGKELPQEAAFCLACGSKVYNGNDVSLSAEYFPLDDMQYDIDSYLYNFSGQERTLQFVKTYIKDSSRARYISTEFYGGRTICHPSGKLYGFIYSHLHEYQNEKNYGCNLYEYDLHRGSFKFLGGGGKDGIDNLYIYNNVAYWKGQKIYRLDLLTGKFDEGSEQWLIDEFDEVMIKPLF